MSAAPTRELLYMKRALALQLLKNQHVSECSLAAERLGRREQQAQRRVSLEEDPVGRADFSLPMLESRTQSKKIFLCGSVAFHGLGKTTAFPGYSSSSKKTSLDILRSMG